MVTVKEKTDFINYLMKNKKANRPQRFLKYVENYCNKVSIPNLCYVTYGLIDVKDLVTRIMHHIEMNKLNSTVAIRDLFKWKDDTKNISYRKNRNNKDTVFSTGDRVKVVKKPSKKELKNLYRYAWMPSMVRFIGMKGFVQKETDDPNMVKVNLDCGERRYFPKAVVQKLKMH